MQVTPATKSGRRDGTNRRREVLNIDKEGWENARVFMDGHTTNIDNKSAGTRQMSTRARELNTRNLGTHCFSTNEQGKNQETPRANNHHTNGEHEPTGLSFTSINKGERSETALASDGGGHKTYSSFRTFSKYPWSSTSSC